MLNKAIIMGRLTKTPELKQTQSGTSVVAFTVACERDYKGQGGERETDFIECVAWRNTAEFICKYFQKGSMAVVVGTIQTRNYEAADGQRRYITEVVAENVYFGESKKASDPSQVDTTASLDFMPMEDTEERLPF